MKDLFDWARRFERPSMVPRDVCHLFEKYALQMCRAGRKHYSARAILHVIRWHKDLEYPDREFKCNNNWTPELSRWFMRCHPEYDGFFRIRASPKKPGHTPDHSTEDYMGPYDGEL